MKRFFSVFLLLAGGLTFVFAQQSGSCGDNLTWTLDEDGTLTISGTGEMYDGIVIEGFEEKITQVIFEEGITYIGESAFQNTKLTGSLILPASLTRIGIAAFSDCSKITGNLTLPAGLTSIGRNAFYGCSGFIGTLTLPTDLTNIGSEAFYGCSGFTNLTLPADLTSIEDATFRECSGFTGNLTLPESLTSIGSYAFYRCTGFTGNLTLPESLTNIGEGAFQNCNLTGNLIIPEKLTSIEERAFGYCRGFTDTLMLPESLLSIGSQAFGNCGFSVVLNEKENPIGINANVFEGLTLSNIKLCVPAGSEAAYSQAEVWKDFNIEEYGVGIHPSFDKAEGVLACGTEVSISGATTTEEIYYGLGKDAVPTLRYTDPIVVSDTTYISAYSRVRNVYSDTIRATYIPEHASYFVGMDWDWSAEHKATLSLTCPRCKTMLKPTVSLSEELTKEATEEESGLKTYTATAVANEVTYKSINREVLPRLIQPIHDTVTITEVKTDTIVITDTVYIEVGTGNTVAAPMTVKLYPNPTNGSFTVEAEEDAYLQIYNAAGVCIQSNQLQGGRFTGSLPSSGLYFIKLTSHNRTYTKRLVVK